MNWFIHQLRFTSSYSSYIYIYMCVYPNFCKPGRACYMASWPRCWWHEFQAKKAKKVGYQYGVLIGCLGRMILHLSSTCLTLGCGCIGLHDVAFAAHLSRARLPLSPTMLLLRWATWFCTSLHPTPSLKQFSARQPQQWHAANKQETSGDKGKASIPRTRPFCKNPLNCGSYKRVASLGWKLFLCLRLSPACLLHATAVAALVSSLPSCRHMPSLFFQCFPFCGLMAGHMWRLMQYFLLFGVNRFLFQWGFNTNKWVIWKSG